MTDAQTVRRSFVVPALGLLCLIAAFSPASAQAPAGEATATEAQAAPPAQPPRIEVAAREIDLGTLVRGESAEARFELRNTGGETLRILNAKPG